MTTPSFSFRINDQRSRVWSLAILTILSSIFLTMVSADAATESIRIRDYFYPNVAYSEWHYLETSSDGGLKANRVRMNSNTFNLNTFSKSGSETKVNVSSFFTESGKYANGTFNFTGAKLEANDFYGFGNEFSTYGFDNYTNHEYIRFVPALSFPERFEFLQSVSRTSALRDVDGRRGGNIKYTIKLLGKGTVTVRGGTFNDCIHLRMTVSFGGGREATSDQWWAKKVGIIKTSETSPKGVISVSELHEYNIHFKSPLVLGSFSSSFGGFLPTLIGSAGSRQYLAIINKGNRNLSKIRVSIEGSSSFTSLPLSRTTLKPGDVIELIVTFKPNKPLLNEAVLRIQAGNGQLCNDSVTLYGMGVIAP